MHSEEPVKGGKCLLPQKMKCKFFPARIEHVVLYLQHVLDTAKSHSAVDSAIYGIQWAHNLAGFPSPTDSPIIHSISRVVKQLIGTRLVNTEGTDIT